MGLRRLARAGERAGSGPSPRLDRARGRHPVAPQYVIERIGELAGPEGTTWPASGSTRCGRRSSSSTNVPMPGSTPGPRTMGYAVPAAMGAKVAEPDRTVWAIDGDGCFQMTNQELATCVINNIPIKVAIINNSIARHGAPVADALLQRALLEHRPARRCSACPTSSSSPRRMAAWACGARRPRRSTPPSSRRHGDQRPTRRHRLRGPPRRDGVADGARRREQRQDPGRPRGRGACLGA